MPNRDSCVFLWSDKALFIGPRSETDLHTHHAVEVCMSLDDSIDMSGDDGTDLRGVAGAMVSSDTPHQLTIHGPRVAIIYIDPECPLGLALRHHMAAQPISPLPNDVVLAHRPAFIDLLDSIDLNAADAACAAVLAHVGPWPAPTRLTDERVIAAMQAIEERLDERIVVGDIAESVGLSKSRFMHLFREHAGLPVRRYVLWKRLRHALTLALAGESFTNAAHASGFSDSAHLTRTCRQMFGLAPSAFAPVDALIESPLDHRPGADSTACT